MYKLFFIYYHFEDLSSRSIQGTKEDGIHSISTPIPCTQSDLNDPDEYKAVFWQGDFPGGNPP